MPTQTQTPLGKETLKPREITNCDLSRNPAAYNHELVRLSAFVTHGFEDFHFVDPTCNTPGFSLWVMYGGKAETDISYCCPGEAGANFGQNHSQLKEFKFRLMTMMSSKGSRIC